MGLGYLVLGVFSTWNRSRKRRNELELRLLIIEADESLRRSLEAVARRAYIQYLLSELDDYASYDRQQARIYRNFLLRELE